MGYLIRNISDTLQKRSPFFGKSIEIEIRDVKHTLGVGQTLYYDNTLLPVSVRKLQIKNVISINFTNDVYTFDNVVKEIVSLDNTIEEIITVNYTVDEVIDVDNTVDEIITEANYTEEVDQESTSTKNKKNKKNNL